MCNPAVNRCRVVGRRLSDGLGVSGRSSLDLGLVVFTSPCGAGITCGPGRWPLRRPPLGSRMRDPLLARCPEKPRRQGRGTTISPSTVPALVASLPASAWEVVTTSPLDDPVPFGCGVRPLTRLLRFRETQPPPIGRHTIVVLFGRLPKVGRKRHFASRWRGRSGSGEGPRGGRRARRKSEANSWPLTEQGSPERSSKPSVPGGVRDGRHRHGLAGEMERQLVRLRSYKAPLVSDPFQAGILSFGSGRAHAGREWTARCRRTSGRPRRSRVDPPGWRAAAWRSRAAPGRRRSRPTSLRSLDGVQPDLKPIEKPFPRSRRSCSRWPRGGREVGGTRRRGTLLRSVTHQELAVRFRPWGSVSSKRKPLREGPRGSGTMRLLLPG